MNIKKYILLIILISIAIRLWGIDFGLPYYKHNDESEIVEPVISATFQLKELVINRNIWVLKPQSYVYGTTLNFIIFPVMVILRELTKILEIPLIKESLYLAARVTTALVTMQMLWAITKLTKKMFYKETAILFALLLVGLNWELIVYSHFVNSDIFLTLFVTFFYYFTVLYLEEHKTKNIILAGMFLGLAIGTKITALIALPAVFYIFYSKKDFKNFITFGTSCLLTFLISNPFVLIDTKQYANRIIEMLTREGGTVLSSANNSIFRYISSLSYLATPIVFLIALLGYKVYFKEKKEVNIFLGLNVIIYVLFFTLTGERKTDRWMLPILPIILIYASYGLSKISNFKNKKLGWGIILLVIGIYLYYPTVLLFQFRQDIPKYKSFIWAKENIGPNEHTLVISETGYSPFNERKNSDVYTINVYESLGAIEQPLPNINDYHYVIVSSKSMETYKNKLIQKKYPEYFENWKTLENRLNNQNLFSLTQRYDLKGSNIITLAEMKIYKNKNLFCVKSYR